MNLGSPGVTSVNRLAKKTVLSLKDYLFCPRGAGESPPLRAEGTLKIGEPLLDNYFRLYMDRAISQDAFGIPGIEHRRVGGLENCVVSCDLLILQCEGILDAPSLRVK